MILSNLTGRSLCFGRKARLAEPKPFSAFSRYIDRASSRRCWTPIAMKQYGVVAQNSDLEPVAQSRIVANGYTGALGVALVCGLAKGLSRITES